MSGEPNGATTACVRSLTTSELACEARDRVWASWISAQRLSASCDNSPRVELHCWNCHVASMGSTQSNIRAKPAQIRMAEQNSPFERNR
jgi:hypothetical protein